MSKIYKCDICGTPYGTGSFKRSTDYAVIGVKDFIDSRTKKEEEQNGN